MNVMPRDKSGQIAFCGSHLAKWEENHAAIGTSLEMVAELAAKTAEAREAYAAQKAAQNKARSATQRLNQITEEMQNIAASIIKQVRAKAAVDGDGVYALASIPVPASPSPINQLDQPTRFTTELDAIGVVTLKWKCTQPRGATGTRYEIRRRIVGRDADFVFIGSAGKKRFRDETLPAGASEILYEIRAVRSTGVGPWANHMVMFGGSGKSAHTFQTKSADQLAA